MRKNKPFIYGFFVLLSFLPVSASISALAAPIVPDAADIPRPQPSMSPPVKPADINQREKPAYQPAVSGKEIRILVNNFTFSGNRSYPSEQLNGLLQSYTGREIGFTELNQATKTITDFYRQQGYFLAQAYLPTQNIEGDTIEISVLEGELGVLKLNNAENLDAGFLQDLAAYRLQAGGILKEQNLVRNVTLMNALPAMRATAQLNPGEAIGSSDAELELQPLPKWQGQIALNTYGNRFTGREVVQAGANVNNLAGRGDQLFFSLKNSRDDGQRGLNLGYLLPIHASGTLLSASYNFVDYKLGGPFKQLDASGDSHYLNLGLDQPLYRDAQKGWSAHFGGTYKWVDDDVSAFALNNRRNVSNIDIGLLGDSFNQSGDTVYQAAVNLRSGHVDFKDQLAESLDESGTKTKGHFVKFNLMFTRMQYFSNGLSLALRADYQSASKNLDSVEKMGIGGINRWRAFAELPSLADTGYMAGIELRKNIVAGPKLANILLDGISPYGFIDFGRGKINQKALSEDNHVRSTSYGFGIDMVFRKNWGLNFAASHQRRKFDGASEEHETRAWGQLQMNF